MFGSIDVPVGRPNDEMVQQLLIHVLDNPNHVDGLVST
jgi:hypothetical protein